MNIIAGGFYDGLMLYAHALNETMAESAGRPPGADVTKRMWNRTFHGQCPMKFGAPAPEELARLDLRPPPSASLASLIHGAAAR
ncbi:Atrial natriuretic peptide receptor 2 [Liparis tanakae]|uniref:Atrial natriuretic peptide receptor 2 n=1 Tax=Liparis tanakae TaxID=230148 RepID=A0A4Z2EGA3_9TELE|nr:Atrial natriuretic peptide receptor 2 [Liparis tanakae]